MRKIRVMLYLASMLLLLTNQSNAQQSPSSTFNAVVETITPLETTMSKLNFLGRETPSLMALSPQAAAPQLSRELVYAVGSTQYSSSSGNFWEYMTTIGQTSTVGDHGGAQLRVVVQEIGYGGSPTSRMNGVILSKTADYEDRTRLVSEGDQHTIAARSALPLAGDRCLNRPLPSSASTLPRSARSTASRRLTSSIRSLRA